MLERYMKHHTPEKEGEEAPPPPSQTARLRMSLSRSVAREGSFRTPQRGGGAAGEPSTPNGSPQSDVLAQLVVASKIQRRDQIAAKSSGSPKKKKAPKFNPMNRAPGVRVTSRQIRDYLKPERPRLTPREKECLQWAAFGKSEWEVSQILGISEHTAEKHLLNAKTKLGASNRVHAVAEAIRCGVLD